MKEIEITNSSNRDEKILFNCNLDISNAYVYMETLKDISSDNIELMVERFNLYGFLIIDCGTNQIERKDFLSLRKLFGRAETHPRADSDGVVAINSFNPVVGHLDSTNAEHLLHTDGSFAPNPGNVLALQCNKPSRIGGLSLIASGHAAYLHLKKIFPDNYHLVHMQDAIGIKRNAQQVFAPIFDLVEGRSRIRFRFADGVAEIIPKPEVAHLYAELCRFFQDNKNIVSFQLHANQVLIADNGALVHGRTCYPDSELRDLRRLNFVGDGSLQGKLKFGFKVSPISEKSTQSRSCQMQANNAYCS